MKYRFTEEDVRAIREARRQNRDKNVERRLKALELRAEGHIGKEIAERTEYSPWYISKLAATYHAGGIEARTGNHYGRSYRNMTYEDEAGFRRINKPE